MTTARAQIQSAIDRLIALLDEMDGDPDFEDEEFEEQHDAEADLTWSTGDPQWFVIAEQARRKGLRR